MSIVPEPLTEYLSYDRDTLVKRLNEYLYDPEAEMHPIARFFFGNPFSKTFRIVFNPVSRPLQSVNLGKQFPALNRRSLAYLQGIQHKVCGEWRLFDRPDLSEVELALAVLKQLESEPRRGINPVPLTLTAALIAKIGIPNLCP